MHCTVTARRRSPTSKQRSIPSSNEEGRRVPKLMLNPLVALFAESASRRGQYDYWRHG